MKRDKSFFYVLVMFLFVTCYITCYILSNRFIRFGGLIATASALVYPLTYFIAVLFYERYGENRTFELINFSVLSLVFMGVLFAFASTFEVYYGYDGFESLFNTDFRLLFSSVVGFMVGQYIMIKLYDILGNKKGFDFLIAGVIAITVDSFLFIGLANLGTMDFPQVISLATGQYSLNVIAIIIYALCFNSIAPGLVNNAAEEKATLEAPKAKTTTKKKKKKKTTTKSKAE